MLVVFTSFVCHSDNAPLHCPDWGLERLFAFSTKVPPPEFVQEIGRLLEPGHRASFRRGHPEHLLR